MLNALQAQALLITYISKSKESTYCKRSHHRPQLWLRAIAQCYDVRILKHLDHHHQSIMVLSLIRNQPSFGQIKSDRNLMIWNGGSILVALIPLISFFVARHGVANAGNNGQVATVRARQPTHYHTMDFIEQALRHVVTKLTPSKSLQKIKRRMLQAR